jgi:hypothetical protein
MRFRRWQPLTILYGFGNLDHGVSGTGLTGTSATMNSNPSEWTIKSSNDTVTFSFALCERICDRIDLFYFG